MKSKLISAVFAISTLFSMTAHAATYNATYDGYNTYGDRDYLLTTNYTGFLAGYNQYIFLDFDLSGATAPVTSATLNMYKTSTPNTGYPLGQAAQAVSVFNMATDVGSNPDTNLKNDILGIAIDTVYADADGWYQWDITNLVNGWIDGSIANNGLALYGMPDYMTGTYGGVYFQSTEYGMGPFISAVPEPSTLGLMFGGLGLVGLMAYRSKKENV